MMATVPHVTSGSGLRKFQADGLLFDRVYIIPFLLIARILNLTFAHSDITYHTQLSNKQSFYSFLETWPYISLLYSTVLKS